MSYLFSGFSFLLALVLNITCETLSVGSSTGDDTAHYYSTTEQGNIDKPMAVEYSMIEDDEYLEPVLETVNQLLPHHLEGNFSIKTTFCFQKQNKTLLK